MLMGEQREHPLHDPADPATSWALNPWVPMTRPIDLKHLGKLGEELNECGAAVMRCIIQGIDEAEPVTGKVNRKWLEDEAADVLANIDLVIEHFGLDAGRISERVVRKQAHLRGWHSMLAETDWRDRSEIPPKGMRIWVTDGAEIWMLIADGKPFPERASLCRAWTPAAIPALPDGSSAYKVED
jgi:hypothetical protein